MSALTAAGIGIVVAAASVFVRREHPSLGVCLSVCAGAILFIGAAVPLARLIDQVKSMMSSVGIDNTLVEMLVKSLGICLLTQFSSDCCRDAGESALAGRVELFGKVAVLIICFPIFKSMVGAVIKLI